MVVGRDGERGGECSRKVLDSEVVRFRCGEEELSAVGFASDRSHVGYGDLGDAFDFDEQNRLS
jgi:hypothetical protein